MDRDSDGIKRRRPELFNLQCISDSINNRSNVHVVCSLECSGLNLNRSRPILELFILRVYHRVFQPHAIAVKRIDFQLSELEWSRQLVFMKTCLAGLLSSQSRIYKVRTFQITAAKRSNLSSPLDIPLKPSTDFIAGTFSGRVILTVRYGSQTYDHFT